VVKAIEKLTAPDTYSMSKEHEGRRIEVMEGGFQILNYVKYRDIRTADERRAYMREYMREKRAVSKPVSKVSSVSPPEESQISASKTKREKPSHPKYSQEDFDQRDMRKIADARKKLDLKLQARVGSDFEMTNGEYYATIAEDTGLSVKRILALLDEQKKWPA
jgi:hypothetical protein